LAKRNSKHGILKVLVENGAKSFCEDYYGQANTVGSNQVVNGRLARG